MIPSRRPPRATRPATSASTRSGRWPRRPACRSCSTSAARRRLTRTISRTACPRVKDFHGGDENFTSVTFMPIPLFGLADPAGADHRRRLRPLPEPEVRRHRTGRLLAAQPGCSSWIRRAAAFGRTRSACRSSRPSPARSCAASSASRPIRTRTSAGSSPTPARTSCLFSSDFPHVEGGRNPLKRFNDSLAGRLEPRRSGKFYRDNFIDLMGEGLAADLRRPAHLVAA